MRLNFFKRSEEKILSRIDPEKTKSYPGSEGTKFPVS